MTKQDLKDRENQLIDMTTKFCEKHLDMEYAALCEKLIKKMGRKKVVPFEKGKIEIWASAVVHTIGSINFLFDKSFEPYISADQICEHFGTKISSVSSKAREIKTMFNLSTFSPEFSTQNVEESNPFKNLVMVDGFLTPLLTLPQDMQQMVHEARSKGKDIEFYSK